jgi:hypothetical protein
MTGTEFTAHKLANVDSAAAEPRLSHLDFRLFWLLASAADRKTGVARRKQTDLARALGVTPRAVRRCLDHLVSLGYLKPIGQSPGGYVNGYNVLAPKRGLQSPLSEKEDSRVRFDNGQADSGDQKADSGDQNEDSPFLHDPLVSLDLPSEPNRESETGGPRRALVALGPLAEELSKKIGLDSFKTWFVKGEAELISQTADTITIAVNSKVAAWKLQNDYGDLIARVSGAERVVIEARKAEASRAAP